MHYTFYTMRDYKPAFLTPLIPFLVEESLEGLTRKFRAVEVNEV